MGVFGLFKNVSALKYYYCIDLGGKSIKDPSQEVVRMKTIISTVVAKSPMKGIWFFFPTGTYKPQGLLIQNSIVGKIHESRKKKLKKIIIEILSEVSIKEESRSTDSRHHAKRRHTSKSDVIEPGAHDDSHSNAGSDLEYDYGMEGASGSSSGMPPGLMGDYFFVECKEHINRSKPRTSIQ